MAQICENCGNTNVPNEVSVCGNCGARKIKESPLMPLGPIGLFGLGILGAWLASQLFRSGDVGTMIGAGVAGFVAGAVLWGFILSRTERTVWKEKMVEARLTN